MDDERFAKFKTDPKFRTVPKKHKKLKIDPRFQHVFTDKRFDNQKLGIDKRGRPKSYASKESYEQFYSLNSSDNDSDTEKNGITHFSVKDLKRKVHKLEERKKTKSKIPKTNSEDKLKEYISDEDGQEENSVTYTRSEMLKDRNVDYARGEGMLLSESSSEESSSEEENDKDIIYEGFDKWGELDHDAENIQSGEETNRLAVCNLDWDRVTAKDIYVALSSFCTNSTDSDKRGLKSVKVYLSEFGRLRLLDEDKLGPEELLPNSSKGDATNEGADENEDSDEEYDLEVGNTNYEEKEKRSREKVRKYQVNRLRYYYAVAEFWSTNDADTVYKACDGTEYELSGTRFDLRFIPEDTVFEENPTDICKDLPNPDSYKPKIFFNTALMQGKVTLTWDETDPEREAAMKRAFELSSKDGNDENEDVKAYLAMSSSDDEERNDENGASSIENELSDDSGMDSAIVENKKSDTNDALESYKNAVIQADGKKRAKKKKKEKIPVMQLEGNMEMTFTSTSNEFALDRDLKQKQGQNLTPWEKYLSRKKEKEKTKRQARKLSKTQNNECSDDSEENTKLKKIKHTKTDKDELSHGDLSLLAMDSDDDKQHFDYKEIVKKESKRSKKLKKKLAKEKTDLEENFEVDKDDDRFAAVFQNADYNIDPSHPNFKKTESMLDLVAEKQRRALIRQKKEKKNKSLLNDRSTSVHKIKTAKAEPNSLSNQEQLETPDNYSSPKPSSDLNRLVRSVQLKSLSKRKEKYQN